MEGGLPPRRMSYTLVGFGAELDWRPLKFSRPIPGVLVCSACGLVRIKYSLLPCKHVLCGYCYEQCANDNLVICPLDGLQCPDETIKWPDVPIKELFRSAVACWNKDNGCTAVVAVSNIFQHFQLECRHHSSLCPKCSAPVLCSDICAHLRSDCALNKIPLSSGSARETVCQDESVGFTAFKGDLEEQVFVVKELEEQSLREINTLKEIWQDLNVSAQEIRQELLQAVGQSHDDLAVTLHDIATSNDLLKACVMSGTDTINSLLSRLSTLQAMVSSALETATRERGQNMSWLAAAVTNTYAAVKEDGQMVLDRITRVGQNVELQADYCNFYVSGVKSLVDDVELHGSATYESRRLYLRGYLISPGVCLRKDVESVKVLVMLKVHRGDMDDLVVWPLEYTIRFSVVHPSSAPKRQFEVKPPRSAEETQRPIGLCNGPVCFGLRSLDLGELIRDGYVYGDQLRVQLELLL